MSSSLATVVPLTGPTRRIPRDIERYAAQDVLRVALEALGRDRVALSSSFGPEDIVVLDLLAELAPRPRVFTLDTGRLPQETYDLIDRVRDRFDLEVEVFFPRADAVETMVRERGMNLFYASVADRRRCCDVRKVEPLGRALATLDGWITGLRRDQLGTRARTPKIGLDLEHGMVWKIAPLADWTSEQVWGHIRARDLPYNQLHALGYPSVGCAPCTRAVPAGDDPRSGRWWWEDAEDRECGLHVGPVALAPGGGQA